MTNNKNSNKTMNERTHNPFKIYKENKNSNSNNQSSTNKHNGEFGIEFDIKNENDKPNNNNNEDENNKPKVSSVIDNIKKTPDETAELLKQLDETAELLKQLAGGNLNMYKDYVFEYILTRVPTEDLDLKFHLVGIEITPVKVGWRKYQVNMTIRIYDFVSDDNDLAKYHNQ